MKALRRTFYDLRTEGQGRVREACAIGVGLFIGCMPFYGFHLLLCWMVGRLLGLNRLKVYLAANVSNPIVAPLLVFVELQTGAWIRTGSFLALTLETARTITPWQFGAHLLVGSRGRRRRARGDRRRRDLSRAGWRSARSVLRQFGACGRRPLRDDEHYGVGVRARKAARRSGVSRRAARRMAAVGRHDCSTSDAGRV